MYIQSTLDITKFKGPPKKVRYIENSKIKRKTSIFRSFLTNKGMHFNFKIVLLNSKLHYTACVLQFSERFLINKYLRF
jgi:hypothetical protein